MIDAFTAHKYMTSQRESDLREVAYIIKTGQSNSLVAACDMVGLDASELTQHEIDIIKKLVNK